MTNSPQLAEQHEKFFLDDPNAVKIHLNMLVPTRARPDGINNARLLMIKAFNDQHPRRDPITVRKRPDGLYDIIDGNSTFFIAREWNWTQLPATII